MILENGCVSFVVWDQRKLILFSTITDVIDRFVEVPRQDPDAPDALRLLIPVSCRESWKTLTLKMWSKRQLNFQIKNRGSASPTP